MLDERASAAAQDLRETFEFASIPASPAERHDRTRRLAIYGSLALTACLVAGLAIVLNARDSGERQASPAAATPPKHWGITELPDGWRHGPTGGPITATANTDRDLDLRLTVIRTADHDIVASFGPAEPEDVGDVDPLIIAGREVFVKDGAYVWEEAGGVARVMLPRTVNAEAFIAQLVVADGEVQSTNPGYSEVYSGDIAPFFAVMSPMVTSGTPLDEISTIIAGPGEWSPTAPAVSDPVNGAAPAQNEPAAGAAVVVVRNRPGAVDLVRAMLELRALGEVPTSFGPLAGRTGGITGVIGEESDAVSFAAWYEGADFVAVSAFGVDQSTFDAMVASVGDVDDSTWKQWAKDFPLPADDSGDDSGSGEATPATQVEAPAEPAEGTESAPANGRWSGDFIDGNGTTVSMVEREDGTICFTVTPSGRAENCVQPIGGQWFELAANLYGVLLEPGTEVVDDQTVELRFSDGASRVRVEIYSALDNPNIQFQPVDGPTPFAGCALADIDTYISPAPEGFVYEDLRCAQIDVSQPIFVTYWTRSLDASRDPTFNVAVVGAAGVDVLNSGTAEVCLPVGVPAELFEQLGCI